MFKKFLGMGLVAFAGATAFAQSTDLVRIDNAVTAGADVASFHRNTTHFTYDLRGSTPSGTDWTGSEMTLDVVGAGSIWHASNQRISQAPTPGDPNNLCYVHNLNAPQLTAGVGTNNANSLSYDTFFTAPGSRFNVDPLFASPGLPAPDQFSCPAAPPIVSTATKLRGLSPTGVEIPLAWFDTNNVGLNNTTLARITFQVPLANSNLTVVTAGGAAPSGMQLFAVIRGKSTTNVNSDGNGFGWDIYQVPEPSTMALLALGGLAGLIRRR